MNDDNVRMLEEDSRLVLQQWREPIDVILSDPPYVDSAHSINVRFGRIPFEPRSEATWHEGVMAWLIAWVPFAWRNLRPDVGSAWIFTDAMYLGLWYRIAYVLSIPIRHTWHLQGAEMLLFFGRSHLTRSSVDRVGDAVMPLNTYGVDKSVELLRILLAVTPRAPGRSPLLLDPFAGNGSSLVAGVAEGYRVVGIERDPACVQTARTVLEVG